MLDGVSLLLSFFFIYIYSSFWITGLLYSVLYATSMLRLSCVVVALAVVCFAEA